LLTNELYNGRVIYKGKRYRGEQAAIVGGRQWKNVQTILSRRIPKRGAERNKQGALLKGVLYCPSCNQPMRHTYTSRNEQRYRYYVCTKGEHGCRNRTAAVRLEASVLERLAEVAQNHAVLGKLVRMCAAQSMVSPELLARLHLWVERVTYSQKTGEVSIQLRTKEAKRHGIG
jgi:site-specific DNA recombinase